MSAPPPRGELKSALRDLAAKTWTHPISGQPVQFSAVTIERWFYTARQAGHDPFAALRRTVRKDCGKVSLPAAVAEQLRRQCVATGTRCLGQYAVPQPGPVLVYLAEDALAMVRERVAGMARHRELDLAAVDIHVITTPTLRLDREPHRTGLFETARRLRPRLLLLDPLVRLHGIDENHAGEVAELLAYFRRLQRQLDLSVVLVHHTRKNAAAVAAGQGLRGSSDIHAFGDSNLYLRRTRERLVLSTEHRAAPASPSVYLELVATNAETTHLEVVAEPSGQIRPCVEEQVLALLAKGVELTRSKLRETLSIKNERLGAVLESLEQAGRIHRTSAGWRRGD